MKIDDTIRAGTCLDTVQLGQLEHSFRLWAGESPRLDVRLSRKRILLIFLLIRYTGGKLNEVLDLDPLQDIGLVRKVVIFSRDRRTGMREVQISDSLSAEIAVMLADDAFRASLAEGLGIDAAFVRRKFYERAVACGFPQQLGGPESIRRSRGVELMQGNMPLPAVQKLLGHSTPTLTSSYVSFSEDEIRQITKRHIEKEAARTTSARNSFYGKILAFKQGDIQSLVCIQTLEGHRLSTVITNDSAVRLGLRIGQLVTAEVKAPWVLLQRGANEPESSAENRFHGTVERVNTGKISTEYVVRISAQTELCSITSAESGASLQLRKGDPVWILFNSFAVVLHID